MSNFENMISIDELKMKKIRPFTKKDIKKARIELEKKLDEIDKFEDASRKACIICGTCIYKPLNKRVFRKESAYISR